MIARRTVFVLGAGASCAYGFPAGYDLGWEIYTALSEENGDLAVTARNAGVPYATIPLFREHFPAAARSSIDALLQTRPDFLELGKICIAARLMPRERDERLYPDNPEALAARSGVRLDWYGHLLDRILPTEPDQFVANRLSIITFNFDRSFERRLFLTLQGNYGLDTDHTATLAQQIPVIHVHGQLGAPGWYPGEKHSRPYGGESTEDDVIRVGRRLRIVHEEIGPEITDRIAPCLKEAELVYFLGFGYHKLNLDKLGIPASVAPARVRGTARGSKTGEQQSICSRFVTPDKPLRAIQLEDAETDIIGLLRNHENEWYRP
jgi:hypothetical protein